jgi:hypothetical protein
MSRTEPIEHRRVPRVVALVGTTFATLALVVAFAPLAVAQTDPGPPPGGPHPPHLTAAQKTCLTQHGVQLPAMRSGQPPTAPTDQQRQAFEAAAKACGVQPHRIPLTDAQRACLTQHGVTPPTPGSVKPSSPPSAEQRATFQAAAKACGLPTPPKPPPTGT